MVFLLITHYLISRVSSKNLSEANLRLTFILIEFLRENIWILTYWWLKMHLIVISIILLIINLLCTLIRVVLLLITIMSLNISRHTIHWLLSRNIGERLWSCNSIILILTLRQLGCNLWNSVFVVHEMILLLSWERVLTQSLMIL